MSDDRLDAFARALAAALGRSELSQTAVAEAAGVSDSALSTWKLGRVKPHPDDVLAIERVLDLEAGSLLVYLGYMPVGVPVPEAGFESAILSDPKCDPELRDELLNTITLWRKWHK